MYESLLPKHLYDITHRYPSIVLLIFPKDSVVTFYFHFFFIKRMSSYVNFEQYFAASIKGKGKQKSPTLDVPSRANFVCLK